VENHRFVGNSIIVDLIENNIVTTKITKLTKQKGIAKKFNLGKYEKSRKKRFLDLNNFQ